MGCGSSTATTQTQISKVNLQYKYLFKYIIVGDTGLFFFSLLLILFPTLIFHAIALFAGKHI